LAPGAWWISTSLAAAAGITATAIFGVLGIMAVLAVGLWLLLQVNPAKTGNYSK
jgi:MFS-type transporter involved in bile tolerance (Atg22 family)